MLRLGSATQNTAHVIRADVQDTDAVDVAAPARRLRRPVRDDQGHDQDRRPERRHEVARVRRLGRHRPGRRRLPEPDRLDPRLPATPRRSRTATRSSCSSARRRRRPPASDRSTTSTSSSAAAAIDPLDRALRTGSSRWTISGADKGDVVGILFDGFENLIGAADNNDVFVVEVSTLRPAVSRLGRRWPGWTRRPRHLRDETSGIARQPGRRRTAPARRRCSARPSSTPASTSHDVMTAATAEADGLRHVLRRHDRGLRRRPEQPRAR